MLPSVDHQIVKLAVLVSGKRTNDVMKVSQTSGTNNGSADTCNAQLKRLNETQNLGLTVFGEDPCNRNLRHAHALLRCYFFHSGLSE